MTRAAGLPSAEELAARFAGLLERCRFDGASDDGAAACAVSGGADSTALAVLAVAAGLRPTLFHVDHGLRPGSSDEANLVERLAAQLGVSFQGLAVQVEPGANLEARCREARFGVLPETVMTGHTADDRVETILLNLMRGAGSAGLSAMSAGGRHPILKLRRSETHEVCRSLGLEVVADPSNDDPAFRRNRVRHELLPLINDIAERDVVELVARQADLIGDEVAHLDAVAGVVDASDAVAVAKLPAALARRAMRLFLIDGLPDDHPPDAATVERALDVARNLAVATDLGAGWRLERSAQRLTIIQPAPNRL